MKLSRVRIRNFRCYKQEVSVDLGDLTVFVGKNDVGKSAILDALAVFFDEAKLDNGDVSVSGDKKDLRIICEFDDLPEELVIDANYPTSLSAEYLLNPEGRLEIHKVYNGALQTPKLTGIYAYAMHPTVDGRDDLLQLRNSELKARAADLGVELNDVDSKINTRIRRELWKTADELELRPVLIPLDQETAKKIWVQLNKYMPSFALFKADRASTDQDEEIQDPMKTAIREAIKAKEDELNAIARYVEEEVKAIATATVKKLREMDPTLASELNPRFTSPRWANIFKVSLTGDDEIPINKRGSGVRRLILLNFLRAKAEQKAKDRASNVIYAVEEPETSQHPNNQRMLLKAFHQLAEHPDCQVILTTHTPTLGRLVPADTLRYIYSDDNGDRHIIHGDEATYQLVAKALGVLPDHDVKVFIGVEGGNDINFFRNISHVLSSNGEDVPDLSKLEDEGKIVFFPLGGSNLALWVSRLSGLNRPEVYIFDRDEAPPKRSKYQDVVDEINNRPGCKAFVTGKMEIENYLHPSAIKQVRPNVDITFGDFDDVPALVAQAIHENSGSPNRWEDLSDDAKRKKISRAKVWLNSQATLFMTPDLLDEIDTDNDLRGWLRTIGQLLKE